jgi:hypothetical protein
VEREEGAYLVHPRPDAAPVCDCTDRDDVDVKEAVVGRVLCDALVDGTLEGVEVGLGESEDVLGLVELEGGGEEHGEVALDLGDEPAGCGILGIGVVEGGEVACKEAVDKGLELVRVEGVWGGGEEGEGEDKVAEDVGEEGEIGAGGGGLRGCKGGAEVGEGGRVRGGGEGVELAAELEGDEGLLEVVGAEGGEVGGRGRGATGAGRSGHGGRSRLRQELLAIGSVHFMALVRPPVGLVEELLELPGDLFDPLSTRLHPTPGGCDTPTLGAGLGGLVDGVEFELAAVVEDDDEVDEPVEARLPRCDAAVGVGGGVCDEVGRGETDGASEDGLVECACVAGHFGEHVEHELGVVCWSLSGRECAYGDDT